MGGIANFFSAYLCVPLRLCGKCMIKNNHRRGAEERRDTQRGSILSQLVYVCSHGFT